MEIDKEVTAMVRLQYVLVLIPLALCSGCSEKESISIALNWIPDSQHGGFYAAEVEGYFAEEGLQVAILPGGPNAPVVQQVATGRAEFGVGNADQILMARQQDADIVAVMAVMQNSPRCIMVHQESDIDSFEKLKDMKLAVGAGKTFTEFMKTKVDLSGVTTVPYTGSIVPFLHDKNYAQQAYVFSEPHVAEKSGATVNTLMISDLGFNPYSSCLFVRGEMIREQPEVVEKMVRAVFRGWQKYLQTPKPANVRIRKDNPQMEMASLEFGAAAIKQLCLPNSNTSLGQMQDARWQTMAHQLNAIGYLDDPSDYRSAYTTEFLNALPK